MGSGVLLPPPGQPGTGPDLSFKSAAVPNVVTFSLDRVGPPSPIYIQRDDQLVIEVVDFSGPHTVSVRGRQLLAPFPRGGQPDKQAVPDPTQTAQSSNLIEPFSQDVSTLAGGPASVVKTLQLTEGYLLSVTVVETSQSTSQRGLVFVRVWINRGATSALASNAFQLLLADYVTATSMVGWPSGRIVFPTEGPGRMANPVVTTPGAGVDWSFQMPAGMRFRIQSVNAQLLTSAGVANRIPRVQIVGQTGTVVWQAPPSSVIAASTTAQVSMSSGQVTSTTDPQTVNITLPSPCILQGVDAARDILRVSTTNIQVGDQWSAISIEAEEWIDNGLL
jgi:hypothetical protein